MKRKYALAFALISTFALTACSKTVRMSGNMVSGVEVKDAKLRRSIAPDKTYTRSINASITIKKSALEQDFFYGADLQYSSIYDKTLDLYTQSSAMGHIPVFFRINGKELQLVADNRRLFPSDVNHPERIVSRFKIESDGGDSLVVSEANSAEFLVTTIDPKAESPRDHWARSFEYVSDGDYVLQESSVIMKDGTTIEVMESIFPRSTLKPSAKFEKFEMDPTDPVGADDGVVARYRLLAGETIFQGEKKLAYAQHFDIGETGTIDWYATANISDEHLEVAREAVEGWNRYFRSFAGISRDVVKFKGRLPSTVKLGDPRYNVINWDSRRVAGAAYESQATDPFSGKQSHSIIYMPVAWFQIGMDYWTQGQYSDASDAAPKPKSLFKLSCMRDLSGASQLLHSGRMSEVDAKSFSIELMKQTLFHEVGHALGLAHNFKGSLSFDRTDPKSMFSSSIMDYNDYEIERPAFSGLNSADGPLLEYDRQALSAIYNKMADVKKADPTLPACNDEEADTEDSGKVDPLCIRYDIEKDPTLSVVTAQKRISEETLAGDVSLSQALLNMKAIVLSDSELKATDTKDKELALMSKLVSSLAGVMNFYVNTGKESLSRTVKNNIKSLYIFAPGVLTEGYSEKEMRERAYGGVESALSMNELPAVVKTTLAKISVDASKALTQTAFAQGMASAESTAFETLIKKTLDKLPDAFAKSTSAGLVKLKMTTIAALVRVPTLPLFFGNVGSSAFDFEKSIVSRVFEIVVDTTRNPLERLTATKVLMTYKDRGLAPELIIKAHAALQIELLAATTNATREFTQALVNTLK